LNSMVTYEKTARETKWHGDGKDPRLEEKAMTDAKIKKKKLHFWQLLLKKTRGLITGEGEENRTTWGG